MTVTAQLLVSNFFMIETIICSHNNCMSRGVINMVEPVCFTRGQCQVQYKHAKCDSSLPVQMRSWAGCSKADLTCKCYFKIKICSPKDSLP